MVQILIIFFIFHSITLLSMDESKQISNKEIPSFDENSFFEKISATNITSEDIEILLSSPEIDVAVKSSNEQLHRTLYDVLVAYNNQLSTESGLNIKLSRLILALNNHMRNKQQQVVAALHKTIPTKPKKAVEDFYVIPASPENSDEENLSVYDTVYLSEGLVKGKESLHKIREAMSDLKKQYANLSQKVNTLLELDGDTKALADKNSYTNDSEIKGILEQNIASIETQYHKNKNQLERVIMNIGQLSLDDANCERDLEKFKSILEKKRDKCWKESEKLSQQKKILANRNGMLTAHEQLLDKELQDARSKRQTLTEDENKFKVQEEKLLKRLERIRKATFALGTIAASDDIQSGRFMLNNENLRKL